VRRALEARGLSPDEVTEALAPPPLQVSEVDPTDAGGEALAFVGTLVLYIAIMSFGYYVASGSSRRSRRVWSRSCSRPCARRSCSPAR
jgi:hypothetical protein